MMQKLVLVPVLLFISCFTFPQNPLEISNITDSNRKIQDCIEVYIDKSNNLDINEIISDRSGFAFIPLKEIKEEISSSYTYWIHFAISRNSLDSLSLGLQFSKRNHFVDIYSLIGKSLQQKTTGFHVLSIENDEIIPFSNIVEIPRTQYTEYFIRITNVTYQIPRLDFEFVNLKEEFSKKNRTDIFQSFLLGILFLMLLYGLFLYFHIGDRVYLFYSLYILSISIWHLFYLGYQFIYTLPRGIYNYPMIFGYLALFFYLKFVRSFINAPIVFPRFNKVLMKLEIAILVVTIGLHLYTIVFGGNIVVEYLHGITTLAIIIFIVIIIIKVYLADIRFSVFIWLGSSLLIIGTLGALIRYFSLEDELFNFQKIGTLLELIIFSYGLSLRYKILGSEKEQYQMELIEQLHVNGTIQEKANKELESKVVKRTAEISKKNHLLRQQNEEIIVQRDLVSEQHLSITKSIQYAKQIQTAMLPPVSYFSELLNEVFILFKPLDIVSGDFYWVRQVNQYVIITAADCTGHGVPGAFMSMLGISSLNEIAQRREITQANQVLNELRYQIKQSLRQHGQHDESRDGIDMSLCVIDLEKRKMQFSGAYNPLYLIKGVEGEAELVEIKADRMPVGYFTGKDRSFTNHEIQLDIGDTFYLFSDGFIDQIGGIKNKKFMSKNFKRLLLEVHDKPLYLQKGLLEKALSDWMGHNSQVDDILVIGIRI